MHCAEQDTDMAAVRKADLMRYLAAIGAGDRVEGVGAAQEAADSAQAREALAPSAVTKGSGGRVVGRLLARRTGEDLAGR
jgi:hypothetical protein